MPWGSLALIALGLLVAYQAASILFVYYVPLDLPERAPAPPLQARRILIDPGHGGDDAGTLVAAPLLEKDFNWSFSNRLKETVTSSGNIVADLSRDERETCLPGERVKRARRGRYDVLVSIHGNSHWPVFSGYMVIHSARKAHAADKDAELARHIAQALYRSGHKPFYGIPVLPPLDRVLIPLLAGWADYCPTDRRLGVYSNTGRSLTVIDKTECPAALVELGFLSNRSEREWLCAPENQARLAQAVAEGISSFFSEYR